MTKAAMRPLLSADVAVLAAIFAESVMQLTGDDYSEAQQEAWAAVADDEASFGKRLAAQLTLVATQDGAPVGFVSLKGADEIDLLYVHPDAAGQGIGTMLCDAIEKLASARAAKALTAEVSDNAQVFFGKRGFTATQRNTRTVNGEWLANTTMRKELSGAKDTNP